MGLDYLLMACYGEFGTLSLSYRSIVKSRMQKTKNESCTVSLGNYTRPTIGSISLVLDPENQESYYLLSVS